MVEYEFPRLQLFSSVFAPIALRISHLHNDLLQAPQMVLLKTQIPAFPQ